MIEAYVNFCNKQNEAHYFSQSSKSQQRHQQKIKRKKKSYFDPKNFIIRFWLLNFQKN